MWLLQGRFAEDSRQELSKLLKYGQSYVLGRKIPADIVINSKFVSRISCHITVASQDTISDKVASLTDPLAFHNDVSLRPKVTIRFEANKSRKTFGVTQYQSNPSRRTLSEPTEIQVPADQEHVLQDRDSFALTTTISLRLVWRPVAICFDARVKESAISPLRKPALQLGIYLSPAKSRWRHGFTHLCLIQIKPTESVLCALLQARPIVTIDYFHELLRRAELLRHDPASLETNFVEPDSAAYQPTIDQQELSDVPDISQKLLPNERRTYMLKGTTCVFFALPSEDSELSIYKSLLTVAGAHILTHDPHAEHLNTKADFAQLLMPYKNSALSYWRNSGSKARSEAPDDGLVVLVSALHDGTSWKDACTVACSNLRIAMPSGFHAITNAVFAADVRAHLNLIPNMADRVEQATAQVEAASAASAAIPNPQQDSEAHEGVQRPASPSPAVPPQVERPATESQAASPPEAPAAAPSSSATETMRRPLTRRTRKPAHTEDDVDARRDEPRVGEAQPVQESAGGSLDPSSQPIRSGLTRRTGTSRANARRSDIFNAILGGSDGTGSIRGDVDRSNESLASATSALPRSKRYRMDLDEEDRAQESLAQSQAVEASQPDPASSLQKRKSPPSRQVSNAQFETAAKRTRTTAAPEQAPNDEQSGQQPVQISRHDAPTDTAGGLPPGALPDTEPQFLQALNTQRAKGKKMDEFDAEFNRLQIARPSTSTNLFTRSSRATQPDTVVDDDYEAFKRMAEEELRIHVRGNFVQVDFVPLVVKKKTTSAGEDEASQSVRTIGGGVVPNFKKFRPKCKGASTQGTAVASGRAKVAMVLPESNDYGLGQAYWGEQDGQSLPTSEGGRGRGRAGRTASRQIALSKEESGPITQQRSRGKVALDEGSVEGAAVDLELDGLDSVDSAGDADMTTMLERRHGPRSQATKRKRPAALVQDSDDDMGSLASASVSQARKKRAPPMVVEDDDASADDGDDGDGGNFAGFGGSTSTRRRRGAPASGTGRARRSIF